MNLITVKKCFMYLKEYIRNTCYFANVMKEKIKYMSSLNSDYKNFIINFTIRRI